MLLLWLASTLALFQPRAYDMILIDRQAMRLFPKNTIYIEHNTIPGTRQSQFGDRLFRGKGCRQRGGLDLLTLDKALFQHIIRMLPMPHLSWKGGARPFALHQNIKHCLVPKQNHLKAYQNNLHVPGGRSVCTTVKLD